MENVPWPQWELVLKFQAGHRFDPGDPHSKRTIIQFCGWRQCMWSMNLMSGSLLITLFFSSGKAYSLMVFSTDPNVLIISGYCQRVEPREGNRVFYFSFTLVFALLEFWVFATRKNYFYKLKNCSASPNCPTLQWGWRGDSSFLPEKEIHATTHIVNTENLPGAQ